MSKRAELIEKFVDKIPPHIEKQDRGVFRSEREWKHIAFVMADEIERLEKELGFWMGEHQDDRPEMVLYRKLCSIPKEKRTRDQCLELIDISNKLMAEVESVPELLKRIEKLRTDNTALRSLLAAHEQEDK